MITAARLARDARTLTGVSSFGDKPFEMDRQLARERLDRCTTRLALSHDTTPRSRFEVIASIVQNAQARAASTLGDMLVSAQAELREYSGARRAGARFDRNAVQA